MPFHGPVAAVTALITTITLTIATAALGPAPGPARDTRRGGPKTCANPNSMPKPYGNRRPLRSANAKLKPTSMQFAMKPIITIAAAAGPASGTCLHIPPATLKQAATVKATLMIALLTVLTIPITIITSGPEAATPAPDATSDREAPALAKSDTPTPAKARVGPGQRPPTPIATAAITNNNNTTTTIGAGIAAPSISTGTCRAIAVGGVTICVAPAITITITIIMRTALAWRSTEALSRSIAMFLRVGIRRGEEGGMAIEIEIEIGGEIEIEIEIG